MWLPWWLQRELERECGVRNCLTSTSLLFYIFSSNELNEHCITTSLRSRCQLVSMEPKRGRLWIADRDGLSVGSLLLICRWTQNDRRRGKLCGSWISIEFQELAERVDHPDTNFIFKAKSLALSSDNVCHFFFMNLVGLVDLWVFLALPYSRNHYFPRHSI